MINLATFRGVGGDKITRCWFQTSWNFYTDPWGNDSHLTSIFFKWVETTN